ncbi:MAG: MBL fold metallo-hydrolase [Chloroflexota bacterium]|nr:MBL fold metallo-hydrolase [Chloroflexota bacterium]
MDVTVSPLGEGIFLASRALAGGPEVRAALLLGTERAAVVDTLARPEDMAPFVELATRHGRPVTVVNTHADWDHAWGNAAFPKATIVGHRLCRERLLGEEERARLARERARDPAEYGSVALVPPDVTFEAAATLHLGGLTLELRHLPGHTADCLVVYVPERRLLLAGDCAEDPFPLLTSGPLGGWVRGLRAWADEAIEIVVPSHGRIGGPELLRRNADYLASLVDEPPLPPNAPAGVAAFYEEAHTANVAAVRRMGTGEGVAVRG